MKYFKLLSIAGLLFITLLGIITISCNVMSGNSGLDKSMLVQLPDSKPVIHSFSATPDTVESGQRATLSWSVSNAKQIVIEPGTYKFKSKDFMHIYPASDFAYTLIASNEIGSVAQHVYIEVTTVNPMHEHDYINFDHVTGRNPDIGFEWEQLYLSSKYQVQIAKDPGFAMIIFDSGIYDPSSPASPALMYLAGGKMEAGHSYYWRARVRQAATGQLIVSPWSIPERFTISVGLPVSTPYYGVQLLSPVNNCSNYPVTDVPFIWSLSQGTTKYRLMLSTDPELENIINTSEVSTNSYIYDGVLEYDTCYFWQVIAIEPAPSDPSSVFSFKTELAQVKPAEELDISQKTPTYIWVAVGIGIILIVVTSGYIIIRRS